MSVALVGDLIRLSLQELGVLPAGDNPSQAEYTDGVDWLNVMLRSWGSDEDLVPNLVSGSFNTQASVASYTVGTGGDFNTTRPHRIINAYSSYQSVDGPMEVQGKAEYNRIQNKAVTGRPCMLFYVPTFPLARIYFDRVPDAVYTITCDMQVPIGDYADENSQLLVSPEYLSAMLYNLAKTLANSYRVVLTPFTAGEAKKTLDRVRYLRQVEQEQIVRPGVDLIV